MEWTSAPVLLVLVLGHCNGLLRQTSQIYYLGSCPLVTIGACPDNGNIIFVLYTRLEPRGVILDLEFDNLYATSFNPSHPTKIAIHGWRDSADDMLGIKDAYLSIGPHNVIVMDYTRLSPGPFLCYPLVIHNTPHVGRCLAQFVQWLRAADAHDLHMIGFSLGAHVASFASKQLRPYHLPRITGLDPAKPFFITLLNDNKLDPGDAVFVDVLHTAAGYQGVVEQSGHVDFFVNGGFIQTGCSLYQGYFQGCNHRRVLKYFAESINSTVGFWGWPCNGIVEAALGRCMPKLPALLMGEHAALSARGVVHCPTGSVSPFALGPWTTSIFRRKRRLPAIGKSSRRSLW